jgi:hypothetical protein
MMKKEHRLQIHFERDMSHWLQAQAEKRRCSMAHVIRELILKEMESQKQ